MNTIDDRKRVEEIRQRQISVLDGFVIYDSESPADNALVVEDIPWLLTQIDVLTFKLTNVTTERDVANAEIERLKVRDMWLSDSESQLTAANAKVEKLREAYRELLIRIANSYKGSIGSIDNVYLPQLNREQIDQALADTEEK